MKWQYFLLLAVLGMMHLSLRIWMADLLMLYAQQVSAMSPSAMTTSTAHATIHMITQQKQRS